MSVDFLDFCYDLNVATAANWLSKNREAVRGPLIPFMRYKFNLTAVEAMEASELAHALEFDRYSRR